MDAAAQYEFDINGFIVMKRIIEAARVAEMNALIDADGAAQLPGCAATPHHPRARYRAHRRLGRAGAERLARATTSASTSCAPAARATPSCS